MIKKIGAATYHLPSNPSIVSYACGVGKKEGEGPLKDTFDRIFTDTKLGQSSWEKAESAMQTFALNKALEKGELTLNDIDLLLAGDLLNQCIGTGYAARDTALPFYGLYGACSTMAMSLSLASLLVDGGFGSHICAMTSSHFCTAERQYRSPLEYGSQRTPTAQWTATAAGCVVVGTQGIGPYVTDVTTGKIVDWCIKDANNMGAAMAPAAYTTLNNHFADTGRSPSYYDLIITGDLGQLGKTLVEALFKKDGINLNNYNDCGLMLYDLNEQDVHCGGSGCGCSAAVLTGHILNEMKKGTWNKVLFCGTGALHSPVALGQGESIPGICHAVALSTTRG